MGEKEFGDLNPFRFLSDYELENFDELMKNKNSEISAKYISLKESAERNMESFHEEIDKLLASECMSAK